jgi:hypothetical protein
VAGTNWLDVKVNEWSIECSYLEISEVDLDCR